MLQISQVWNRFFSPAPLPPPFFFFSCSAKQPGYPAHFSSPKTRLCFQPRPEQETPSNWPSRALCKLITLNSEAQQKVSHSNPRATTTSGAERMFSLRTTKASAPPRGSGRSHQGASGAAAGHPGERQPLLGVRFPSQKLVILLYLMFFQGQLSPWGTFLKGRSWVIRNFHWERALAR